MIYIGEPAELVKTTDEAYMYLCPNCKKTLVGLPKNTRKYPIYLHCPYCEADFEYKWRDIDDEED